MKLKPDLTLNYINWISINEHDSVSNYTNIDGLHAEEYILVLVDDDIIFPKDVLKKLVMTLMINPEIGCVRPVMYLKDGRSQTLGIKFYKRFGLLKVINLKGMSLRGVNREALEEV